MITVQDIMMLIARVIILFLAFPLHESAHAFVASKLGDPTAKNQGRIAMNPLAHINPLPTIGLLILATVMDVTTHNYMLGNMILLLTSIFFFRAVPINSYYFKNRKAGIALTALAGPVSNILLALVFLILTKIIAYLVPVGNGTGVLLLNAVVTLFASIVSINLQLASFNLIPLPPLDGYNVVSFFIKDSVLYQISRYSNYIMIGMIVLLYATDIVNRVIMFIYQILYGALDFLTGWIDLIFRIIR